MEESVTWKERVLCDPRRLLPYVIASGNADHVMEDFPELVAKWEEKTDHYNMVTSEPHEEQKLKEEIDVRVETRGGVHTRTDSNKGECS